MIISIDAENSIDKIQDYFTITAPKKTRNGRIIPQHNKSYI
jgi:hypothetical protein